jgi:hypothetical protein
MNRAALSCSQSCTCIRARLLLLLLPLLLLPLLLAGAQRLLT